jgi:hypothetical protein
VPAAEDDAEVLGGPCEQHLCKLLGFFGSMEWGERRTFMLHISCISPLPWSMVECMW